VAIASLAGRQHGVISTLQLRELGLTWSGIRRRVVAGSLHPVHRAVYAVGHPNLTKNGRYMAAVLACGPAAALSHRSAADLWDLRRSDGAIEVTVPRSHDGWQGIKVHTSRRLTPGDITLVARIPVTSIPWTLLDLAAVLPRRQLEYTVDRAERLELFDLTAVDDVLARVRGRKGARALREAVAAWCPTRTRSELEERFVELLRSSDFSLPQVNVLVQGDKYTHEVDAYWPEHRLVVELDGFEFHRTRRDRERDAAKTADLELAGHRVMRLTWDEVTAHARRTERRLSALTSKC
jgi:very-short-patch-repair endonuclease